MPEFQIADPRTTPPQGWRYVQPESGRVFSHYSRQKFFEEIQVHRLGNGYPISPSWQIEIEDEMCRAHPEWVRLGISRRIESSGPRSPFSFAAMQSFLQVVAGWLQHLAAGGDPFVDQGEADRRAAICASCELNIVLPFSCGACADFLSRALWTILGGTRDTKYDQYLGACSICSCALKVACHVPLEIQQRGLTEELKNQFRQLNFGCWKKENL